MSEKRPLDLCSPFPSYIYRLFLSQTRLSDERQLKAAHKMSHSTLIKKIEANFAVDRKTNNCSLRNNKGGVELLSALQFVTSFIHSRPAFHVRDFHENMKAIMGAQKISFDEMAWAAQEDRVSLAILCLVSNTGFVLANGDRASCKLETENHFRILNGWRWLPTGTKTSEPTSFGRLKIIGEATVNSFPLIDTDLDSHRHCDPKLFVRDKTPDDFGDCDVEIINFAGDMSLSEDFKLVRTDWQV